MISAALCGLFSWYVPFRPEAAASIYFSFISNSGFPLQFKYKDIRFIVKYSDNKSVSGDK